MADHVDDELEQKRKQKEIEALNEQLRNEMQMWELSEIDPEGIQTNVFLLDQWVFAMRDYLVEKGLLEEQEFLIFFKTKLLRTLKELRPKVIQAKEKAKSEIAIPSVPPLHFR